MDILLSLRQVNPAEPLILLVDSTAAIRRIARFLSQEFRPTWETCKDSDIVRCILDQLLLRTEHQDTTNFVLVHGHSSHPLHERADVLAVQGTSESEDEFDDGTPNGLRLTQTAERWIVWGKQTQRHIQSHFTVCAWEHHKQGTYMEQFLSQENAARTQLGYALKSQDLLGLDRAILDFMTDTRTPPRLRQVSEQTYHSSSTLWLFATRY